MNLFGGRRRPKTDIIDYQIKFINLIEKQRKCLSDKHEVVIYQQYFQFIIFASLNNIETSIKRGNISQTNMRSKAAAFSYYHFLLADNI